ncbi:Hypothetical protein GbCGDNIH9_5109 [Granulibacter bethesdensis]|uniref:Uncharacterized protein n=1 Tax=Granulibacter bethesdensis TaxID=364410 RepID=A0AAC9P8J5_9PROT|nr:Hypothetical protein GbCGDNIH9_5109 [Granulibacter bethesdensis]APH61646.1 Hypothetical protein GbCGDNIH8_8448 [Granulibacter bethesdensis]
MLLDRLQRANASGWAVIRFDLWLGGHAQFSSRCRSGRMMAAFKARQDVARRMLHCTNADLILLTIEK